MTPTERISKREVREWWSEMPIIGKAIFVAVSSASAAIGVSAANTVDRDGWRDDITERTASLENSVREMTLELCLLRVELRQEPRTSTDRCLRRIGDGGSGVAP